MFPTSRTASSEFRTRFYDTNLLGDRYAGSKFAQYLFKRHESPPKNTRRIRHRIVEEAQLFIEAAHAGDILAERRNKPPDGTTTNRHQTLCG